MAKLEDYPAHQHGAIGYPGVNNEENYLEDIFVGYRYTGRKPLFAFGHGLSYTSFKIANAKVEADKLSVEVTNTGAREGKTVVQVYVSPKKPSVPRPQKELKAFQKVSLAPGETKVVEFEIREDMFQYFDEQQHAFVTDHGKYELLVGDASDHLTAKAAISR